MADPFDWHGAMDEVQAEIADLQAALKQAQEELGEALRILDQDDPRLRIAVVQTARALTQRDAAIERAEAAKRAAAEQRALAETTIERLREMAHEAFEGGKPLTSTWLHEFCSQPTPAEALGGQEEGDDG